MEASFLSSLIERYYPLTSEKVLALIESNVLLERAAKRAYQRIEKWVQEYADIAERIRVIIRMIDAWREKRYRETSYVTIFLAAAILLYFISPIDLIPDFIPLIGRLDDLILLAYLLKVIDKEIEKFKAWEMAQEAAND